MKIISIKRIGKRPVYDISVAEAEHYILKNGVVTHNTGGMYSANQVFIIGKAQEKDGTEIIGWNFTINIEKSRFVKEKSKFMFEVTYNKGISKWSGLMDLALESGHCVKPKNGWYTKSNPMTGEVEEKNRRLADTENKEFWGPILDDPTFNKFVEDKFGLSNGSIIQDEDEE